MVEAELIIAQVQQKPLSEEAAVKEAEYWLRVNQPIKVIESAVVPQPEREIWPDEIQIQRTKIVLEQAGLTDLSKNSPPAPLVQEQQAEILVDQKDNTSSCL